MLAPCPAGTAGSLPWLVESARLALDSVATIVFANALGRSHIFVPERLCMRLPGLCDISVIGGNLILGTSIANA